MPVLVTETSTFQPRVLIISDQHVLADQLVAFFQQSDFQVEWWGRGEVEAAAQGKQALDVFDRIVVVLLGSLKESVKELTDLTDKYQTKTTFILPYAQRIRTREKEAPLFEEITTQTEYLSDLVDYVQSSLPIAKFFFLEDVLYPFAEAFQFEQWLVKLLNPDQNLVLNNSSGELFPQTLDQVFIKIQKHLLSPNNRGNYLVRGKKIEWAAFSQLLLQQAQDCWWKEFKLSQARREDAVPTTLKILSTEGISPQVFAEQIVQFYPREIERPEVKIPPITPVEVTPMAVLVANSEVEGVLQGSNHNIVAHPPIPFIENRMKKYEKKMLEVAQRRKLRPVRKDKYKEKGARGAVVGSRSPLYKTTQEKVFEEEVTRLFGTERVNKKVDQAKKKVKDQKKTKRKNKYRSVVLVFTSIIAGIGMGVLAMWGSFFFVKNLTQETITQIAQKAQSNTAISDQELGQFSTKMRQLSQVLSFEVEVYRVVFGPDKLKKEELLASLGSEVPETYQLSLHFKKELTLLVQQFFGQQSGDSKQTLSQVAGDANSAYQRLSVLQNEVKDYSAELDDKNQIQLFQQFANKIQDQRKMMATQIQLQQVLPNLLGFEGKKTYAILLQNNQELRPTGGFLQTIALVTVDNGVLVDSQVFDVSALDKAFSGQVAPPPEVKSYLGGTNWFLRDANWDPDFPQTAQQVQWFLEKMVGKKVDGVVGINLYVLQGVLKQLGPVSLPDYNETLTDKNLFDRVEFHSEIKLVESGKTEYLSAVMSKMLSKISAVPENQVFPLLSAAYDNTKSGQATVFVDQPDKEAVINSLGWGGEVTTPQCPAPFSDQSCLTDTFYQVEANIGINKANYTLEREIHHTVVLSQNSITHQREIDLKNTAVSNAWPLGPYKAYIRFYVPEQANLQDIKIGDAILPVGSVVTKDDHGKKYFGIPIEVPVGSSRQIVLTYTEPLQTSTPFSYVFFEQKQAGTGDDPYSLSVQYSDNLHPTVIAPQGVVNGQSVTFTTTRDKNLFMGLKFN